MRTTNNFKLAIRKTLYNVVHYKVNATLVCGQFISCSSVKVAAYVRFIRSLLHNLPAKFFLYTLCFPSVEQLSCPYTCLDTCCITSFAYSHTHHTRTYTHTHIYISVCVRICNLISQPLPGLVVVALSKVAFH